MMPHMVITPGGKIETVNGQAPKPGQAPSQDAPHGQTSPHGQARDEDEAAVERMHFMRPRLLDDLAIGYRRSVEWSLDDVKAQSVPAASGSVCREILKGYQSWQKARGEDGRRRPEARIVLPYWLRAKGHDTITAYPFGMPPGGCLHVVMRLAPCQIYVEAMHTHLSAYKGEILLRSPALGVINFTLMASFWTTKTRERPMNYKAVMARMEYALMKTFASEYVECSLRSPEAMTPFLL